jgi:DNA-binding LytR/AlgR family response regulator
MQLNCAIIDDEPLARECLINYVGEVKFLNLVGTGSNPLELSELQTKHRVDLIFLDIQMPVMNGIDFLKIASDPPMVIITTAYPSYALEGFQLDVLDYLLKPVTLSRFVKAVTKARDYHTLLQKSSLESQDASIDKEEYFFIKCDHKYERIHFEDILFIEALQNYISINTTNGKYLTLLPLKTVEEKLDPERFMRVHKSFIVSVAKIESIDNNHVVIGGNKIPISRSYRDEVISSVVNKRLWKKTGD